MHEHAASNERVFGWRDVQSVTGLSRPTILRLERAGRFPARRELAPNRIGWLAAEVDEWLRTRPPVGLGISALQEAHHG